MAAVDVLAPNQPKRRRKTPTGRGPGSKRRASDWAVLAVAVVIGLFIAFPFILILINSSRRRAGRAVRGSRWGAPAILRGQP